MNCPDCDREVRGIRCPCGWIAPPPPIPDRPPRKSYTGPSYRERWFQQKGLPYEPPKLVKVPGWARPEK